MSTKIKKILVTGAEGFIGSHLVELLLNKGYEINAFILYNFENRKGLLDEIKLVSYVHKNNPNTLDEMRLPKSNIMFNRIKKGFAI